METTELLYLAVRVQTDCIPAVSLNKVICLQHHETESFSSPNFLSGTFHYERERERQRGRERKRETFFLELATNQVPDDDQCICGAFTTPLPWQPKGQIRRRVCARQLKEGLRVHSTVTFNRANEKRKSILWIPLQHGQLGKNASNASVWAGATSEASQGRRGGVVAFPGSRAASDLFIPAPWHQ